jgi:protocatechuate 3,4-dioxygenase beta subunit
MTRNTKLVLAAVAAVAAVAIVWKTVGSGSAEPADPAAKPADRVAPRTAAALQQVAVMPERQMVYDDDPVGDQRLEGQVIDADENPVGGALVVVDANPRREVRTEEDGSFVFDRLVSRHYRIEARKGSNIAGPVRARVSERLEPVVLRMRPAASLEITVVDAATQRPVSGAMVELRSLAVVAATTDGDGVAVIEGVGAGTLTVKVSATGYAAQFELVTSAGAPGDVVRRRYALHPGVSVSGTVVDTAGQPVEGASVLVENISFLGALSDPRLDAMITDAKGRWRFDALPQATVRFRASHQRFAPTVSAPVPLADGVPRSGVEIVLDVGARLTGHVVDTGGAPAASAVVQVGGASVESALIRQAHCDDDGRFELAGLPRTAIHLVASSETASSPLVSVDLTDRRERDVTVTLDGDHRITGKVVDSSGAPVAEARVVARPEISTEVTARSELRLRGAATAVADGDGGFAIPGLRPGQYRLRAIRPGTPSAVLEMKQGALVASDARDVEVVVDDLTTARGVVSFANGDHPQRFAVSLGSARPQSFVGTDGAFELVDVPTGNRYLTVIGPELLTKFVDEVEIAGNRDNDLGTIVVGRGRTIRGRVVDSTGRPVAGATVDAGAQLEGTGRRVAAFWEETDGTKRVVSGSDGRFVIRGVGPTTQVVVADHETEGRAPTVALPAGTDDVTVELRLVRPGSLRGRITVNGKPAEGGVGLRADSASDMTLFESAGPDGAFYFDRVTPGEHIAFAWFKRGTEVSGGSGQMVPVTIRSGETATADIDFTVGDVSVTLRLTSDGDVVKWGFGSMVNVRQISEPAAITITEARSMMAGMDPDTTIVEGMMVDDRSISFDGLVPGAYTACVAPIDADPRDPEALKAFQKSTVDQIMYCRPVTITPEPKHQEVVVQVQPAK